MKRKASHGVPLTRRTKNNDRTGLVKRKVVFKEYVRHFRGDSSLTDCALDFSLDKPCTIIDSAVKRVKGKCTHAEEYCNNGNMNQAFKDREPFFGRSSKKLAFHHSR